MAKRGAETKGEKMKEEKGDKVMERWMKRKRNNEKRGGEKSGQN